MTAAIFLHIPKAAGLTVRDVLLRNHAPEVTFDHRPDNDEREIRRRRAERDGGPAKPIDRNRAPIRLLRAMDPEHRRQLRLLMGHFWYGLHTELEQPAIYFTFLRDPVERVLSLYGHRRAQAGVRVDLATYLDDPDELGTHNDQTRRLVGGTPRDGDIRRIPVTEAMLDEAKAHLDEMAVGLVDRFDESLVLLADTFGWTDVTYERINVNVRRPKQRDVDPRLVERIAERNRVDAELYRYAAQAFERRAAARPGLAEEASRLATTAEPGPMRRLRDGVEARAPEGLLRASRNLRRRLRA